MKFIRNLVVDKNDIETLEDYLYIFDQIYIFPESLQKIVMQYFK